MSSLAKHRYTPEEYLALEREAEHRSEYFSGEIFAMAGASPQHNMISSNVVTALNIQMRGRPCRAFVSDTRVRVQATGLYTYPDVVAVCGQPQYDGEDCLLNPNVIIEVLSPSTEAYDRGEMFAHFRTVVTLQEYVLIVQDKRRIERFVRQMDGQWLLSVAEGETKRVDLASVSCTLLLSEVYDKVGFDLENK